MPTILDFVDLTAPPDLAGGSLLEPQQERVLFAEKGEQVALRTPQHKLIYHLDGSDAELYALQSDPGERSNLAGSEPELLQTLRDRLFQWIEETEKNPAPGEEVAADSEMLAKLKALGYVK